MAYTNTAGMTARFGEALLKLVADRDNDGTIDEAVVAQAIADADALVDLHCRGRYAVPLAPVPAEIERAVCDLAHRFLYGNSADVPDPVVSADKVARDLLKSIADGKVQLDAAPAPAASDSAALEIEVAGEAPFFTGDGLKGF